MTANRHDHSSCCNRVSRNLNGNRHNPREANRASRTTRTNRTHDRNLNGIRNNRTEPHDRATNGIRNKRTKPHDSTPHNRTGTFGNLSIFCLTSPDLGLIRSRGGSANMTVDRAPQPERLDGGRVPLCCTVVRLLRRGPVMCFLVAWARISRRNSLSAIDLRLFREFWTFSTRLVRHTWGVLTANPTRATVGDVISRPPATGRP